MAKITKQDILKMVTTFYLESADFNGMPIRNLLEESYQDWGFIKTLIKDLIEEELVGLIDTNADANPSIIRTGFKPKNIQISKLNGDSPPDGCIYPRPKHLKSVVNPQDYEGQPYKLCLAFGEAQLSFRSFDLSVLEFYRNDPRYRYENNDTEGHIYYETGEIRDSDKIALKTFGFSYDDNYNRAIAVFLRYLADLTPEHQQIWKAKELQGNYKLHKDYTDSAIQGGWGQRRPICLAFLKELYIINRMAKAMGRPPLFKNDYGEYGENRPKDFTFLIRPTLREFNNFVQLLDKMLSENINKDFFQEEVPYENEIPREDGKIRVQTKGTLQILDDWVRKFLITDDCQPWMKSIATVRKIRKMRQRPAHAVDEDRFDQKYFKEQRELIIEAYSAVRALRLMLANHPDVDSAKIKIPDWLQEGKIWECRD
jgi:hypothetical protein